ncbi:MAG TPA: aldo/keto reductase, partial [Stellaceae bacterium]|nr:aldo/keto reductase [Stellaceae bacterium]
TTPARIALAWVQGRPGVASTILGARTMAQLEDNLAALDLVLDPADVAALDEATRPKLDFPAAFLPQTWAQTYGGMIVNGRSFGSPPR